MSPSDYLTYSDQVSLAICEPICTVHASRPSEEGYCNTCGTSRWLPVVAGGCRLLLVGGCYNKYWSKCKFRYTVIQLVLVSQTLRGACFSGATTRPLPFRVVVHTVHWNSWSVNASWFIFNCTIILVVGARFNGFNLNFVIQNSYANSVVLYTINETKNTRRYDHMYKQYNYTSQVRQHDWLGAREPPGDSNFKTTCRPVVILQYLIILAY